MVDELKALSMYVSDLEGIFRTQRELLKANAMSLPRGTMQSLQTIASEIEALTLQLQAEQVELDQLRALGRTAELVNSTLDVNEVLNQVMSQAIALIHAERGYIVLRDAATGQMEFRVARTMTGNMPESEFIISRSIVQDVANTGNPILATDALEEKRFEDKKSIIGLKLRSILCVPLLLRGEVTGVLYVDNRVKSGVFANPERELLYAFANQAAIAIENARLFERARANLAEVTEVKNLMENVFASIASGVITTDASDRITTLNDAAERILGMARATSLQQPIWDVMPPISEQLPVLVDQVLKHNSQEALEVQPDRPDQSETILSLKLSPLKNSANITQGVAIVVDDLTEARHRDEQLKAIRRYLTPAMVDNIQSIDQLGLGGERREVTAMFIDVRGFSTFSPSLSPREFMQVLNQYLTIAADELNRQAGIIDKYMANEIMALFNTQLNPNDDHSLRAIISALNMAEEYISHFYPQSGEAPGVRHFRVGIHTGIATLGNAGGETRKEFTAIGDSINAAHRILENAQPGQILISQEAFLHGGKGLAQLPNIQIIERGQITVKGKQKPITIYEVMRRVNQE
jgi:PAS domain S-box-containing protein